MSRRTKLWSYFNFYPLYNTWNMVWVWVLRMTFSQKSRNFSGTRIIIALLSSQRLGPRPSKFAALLVFLIFKTSKKISFSKQADCSLTTVFLGPKSFRDFREKSPTAPRFFFLFQSVYFFSNLCISSNHRACHINKLANGSQRICDFTTKRWLFAAEMYYIYREKNSMHFSRYELPRTDARD